MKLLIAGSRSISNYEQFYNALVDILTYKGRSLEALTSQVIKEIVSGAAIGVDKLGERFAKENNINIKRFLPDWNTNGKSAGFIRNQEMIDYLDAEKDMVVLIWDGQSKGTASTKAMAIKKGLRLRERVIMPIVEKRPRIFIGASLGVKQ